MERIKIMFCTTCGRQIIDEARFCNFCGAPVRSRAQQAAPAQQTAETGAYTAVSSEPNDASSQMNGVPMPEAESGADTNAADTSAVTENGGSENAAYGNTFGAQPSAYVTDNSQPTQSTDMGAYYSAAVSMYPTPGNIPQSGGDPSGNYSAPTAGSGAFAAPELEKPKPERKYTLTHIILCLASTAIMAIAAGIFAGLYFSVV